MLHLLNAEPESEFKSEVAAKATIEAASELDHAPWLSSSKSALPNTTRTHACHCFKRPQAPRNSHNKAVGQHSITRQSESSATNL